MTTRAPSPCSTEATQGKPTDDARIIADAEEAVRRADEPNSMLKQIELAGAMVKLPGKIALCRTLLAALRASQADLELCNQRYNEEYRAVDRVWKALGITTYEEACGKEISEHAGDLKSRADAAEAREQALRGALQMLVFNGHSASAWDNARAALASPPSPTQEPADLSRRSSDSSRRSEAKTEGA